MKKRSMWWIWLIIIVIIICIVLFFLPKNCYKNQPKNPNIHCNCFGFEKIKENPPLSSALYSKICYGICLECIENIEKIGLPLSLNFNDTCNNALVIFTGNLVIDKLYNETSNLNSYIVDVEMNEIGNKEYRIIAFLDKIGKVYEGSTGYVSCSTGYIIPTGGIKNVTLDCYPDDIFQEVGDVSRVSLYLGFTNYTTDYNSSCDSRTIQLEKPINKEIFKPLIICPKKFSITKIGEDYIYALKTVSFKVEVGEEFRDWEGEEAGIDYTLIKEGEIFILNVKEWSAPPFCINPFGCKKEYSFEINPMDNTCIKK